MSNENNPSQSTRKIPVINRQTGETKLVDAPEGKPNQDRLPAIEASNPALSNTAMTGMTNNVGTATEINNTKNKDQRVDKKKKKIIISIDEYLELFYTGKVKSLPEESLRSIGTNVSVSTEQRAGLIDKSIKADFSLDKTRQLFVLTLNDSRFTGLAKSLREFAKDVVCRHPVMGTQDIETWFPSLTHNDTSNIKQFWSGFVNNAASMKSGVQGEADRSGKKANIAEIQKARTNAFLCATVWRYAQQQSTFTEFLRSLRSTIFESSSDSKVIEVNLLSYLVSAADKDRHGIADFFKWFHDQTIHVQNLADSYRQRLETLQAHKNEVDELLHAKDEEIEGLKQQIAGLNAQVSAANDEIRVLKVHSKDDLERQASRTLRALEDEIPVLTDCLTALSRDPPKVDVAKEYLATVLDTLNRELKMLMEK